MGDGDQFLRGLRNQQSQPCSRLRSGLLPKQSLLPQRHQIARPQMPQPIHLCLSQSSLYPWNPTQRPRTILILCHSETTLSNQRKRRSPPLLHQTLNNLQLRLPRSRQPLKYQNPVHARHLFVPVSLYYDVQQTTTSTSLC